MPHKLKIVLDEERFAFIDDAELEEKRQKLKNKITTKADCKTEKVFVKYLSLKGLSTEYWLMEEKELNDILCKFWFEVRTAEGDYYKATSLGSLHYGINKMLHNRGHEYSIQ